jgi:hypothetical protein
MKSDIRATGTLLCERFRSPKRSRPRVTDRIVVAVLANLRR